MEEDYCLGSQIPQPQRDGGIISRDMQLILQVLANPHVMVLKSIPKVLRPNVAKVYKDILLRISQNPTILDSFIQLFVFPRAVLHLVITKNSLSRKKRYMHTVTEVRKRLDAWIAGGLARDQLILEIITFSKSQPYAESSIDSQHKYIQRLISNSGQYGKAAQKLVSDIVGIAPPTTDTLNELINKHPTGSVLPHIDISSFSPVSGDAELIIKLLHKFDKDTASGRSGLRVQHLLEMIAVDETFAEALSVALNTILAGKAPNEFASIFSSAPLVPLVKKDGSLRPIAVGEVLRRLLFKICLHKVMSQAAIIYHHYKLVLEYHMAWRPSFMESIVY